MPSKKNRDDTGLLRTLPSMAWLIRERAKLKGKIEAIQRKMEALPREMLELQTLLESLDRTFPLHEVQVEPKGIHGKQPKKPSVGPYGALTKHVLRQLREAGGPVYTAEIALSFARAHSIQLGRSKLLECPGPGEGTIRTN